MNKKFWCTLIAVVMISALMLTACTPKEEPAAKEPTATVVEPAEPSDMSSGMEDTYAEIDPSMQVITYWHQFSRDRETALLEIVEEFNATNEWGITVIPESHGGYSDIFNKMLTFMNTEEAPNLVEAYQNQAATYQLGNSLVDMDAFVYSEKWGLSDEDQADFLPEFFNVDIFPSFGNTRLGFPLNRSMEVMYYNMDWLAELGYDAPPATPAEFKEVACAATANPFSGATAEGSSGYELSVNASRFASWTSAFGGDIFDYDASQYSYDSTAANEAMSFLQDLINEGCASIVTERDGDPTDFGQGTTLFTVGSSSNLPFYGDAVKAGSGHKWSVAAIPHTTADPVMNIYGASISIPKTTPEGQLAAWLFLKHYTNTENQAKWALASNYFPVRASAAEDLGDYFSENPAYQTAFDMLEYGTTEPPVPGYDIVSIMAEEAMAAIAEGADVPDTLAILGVDSNASVAEQMSKIPESPDPWTKVDPSGQTITYWHEHSGDREEALLVMVEEFNATNPWGITVTAKFKGSYGDIFKKMLKVLNTVEAPNLVAALQNQAAIYKLGEALTDMTGLVESIKHGLTRAEQADFFSSFYNADIFPSFDNARLGYPLNRSMEVLYYNMDWLTELGHDGPPATPAEFKEVACAAAANPYSGATAGGSSGYQLNVDHASSFASWTFAFGGDIFDYDSGQYTYNSEAAVAAMTYLQDLFNEGCASIVIELYGDQTDFGQGTTLFTVGSSSGLPFYSEAVEAGSGHEWRVAAVPHTTDDPVMNISGASISMPLAPPEAQLASWLFLKYLTNTENQVKWAQVSNYFPVRASAADDLGDYFAENPAYQTAFDMLQYGTTEPPVPGYNFVSTMVEEAMAAIIDGADVVETLNTLTEVANISLAEQLSQ